MMRFTAPQIQRLSELGDSFDDAVFGSTEERDREFANMFSGFVAKNDARIRAMLTDPGRHMLSAFEDKLAGALICEGFIEVRTPLMISKASLERMTVTEDSELYRQVFQIDGKRCLRPMLAPNLYVMMRKLRKRTEGPVMFFEMGPCFRKESKSSNHLEEFTMLNLVEMGPRGKPEDRLREHIRTVMEAAGLDHEISAERSGVYGETMDVIVNGTEVASGAVGPHILDRAHGIDEAWCGVGFGIERLLMEKMKGSSIRKVGASLTYLNGARTD